MTLIEAIHALYRLEINVRISTFWDGGIDVFLGDEINGYKAEACFEFDEADEIPDWLIEQAKKHWPGCTAQEFNDAIQGQ